MRVQQLDQAAVAAAAAAAVRRGGGKTWQPRVGRETNKTTQSCWGMTACHSWSPCQFVFLFVLPPREAVGFRFPSHTHTITYRSLRSVRAQFLTEPVLEGPAPHLRVVGGGAPGVVPVLGAAAELLRLGRVDQARVGLTEQFHAGGVSRRNLAAAAWGKAQKMFEPKNTDSFYLVDFYQTLQLSWTMSRMV